MSQNKVNTAYLGLNLDSIISQIKPGQLSYAQNAQINGFEGNSITYQNEQANSLCFTLPDGYQVIGTYNIVEEELIVYWLANPTTGDSEIGKVVNCVYSRVINSKCLNFDIRYPIHKAVHKKTACGLEIYWTDGKNPRRYIDLSNLPYKEVRQGNSEDPCDTITTSDIDCNKLNVQPDFQIPLIEYEVVGSEGTTTAGTYQFAVQYANALGDAYTSYYSITNPIPVYDYFKVTPDFNYEVAKSITLSISNLDTTGIFDYINVAVIKTINNISSVDLVGTFQIQNSTQKIVYTGQSKANITLSIDEIFEKFPVYDTAGDITTVQDVLVWADLTSTQRLNYQKIISQIELQWVSWKLPVNKKQFKDEINSAERRGYMRDEVYAYDGVILLRNGYQTDRFPIIGRLATAFDLEIINNADGNVESDICDTPVPKPRWKVYNTASVLGIDPLYDPTDPCYQGPYQYGRFAYWESTETYPCNEEIWGDLAGKPIRHHKFPDNLITNHHDNQGSVYPLGIRVNKQQIFDLIRNSDLSEDEKNNIAAIKIVRANRANSKSIIAKGLLFNVGTYSKGNTDYFYPNYPFNDLRPDPFILNSPNSSTGQQIGVSFEERQTVSTNETDLYSLPVSANTWSGDGDIITALYNGKFSGDDDKKRLRVYLDANTVYDSGLLTVDDSNSFILSVEMKRTSFTRIDIKSKLQIFGQNARTINSTGFLEGVDFSVIHNVVLTGTIVPLLTPTVGFGSINTSSAELGYKKAPTISNGPDLLEGFNTSASQRRFTFHSPDTSFYQPFLGNIVKFETVEYGNSRSHFVQVKNHARYRFPSLESYLTSLAIGIVIGFASGTFGLSTNAFNGAAAFTAFSTFNDIVFRLLPKKNMAYQFNSLGNYTRSVPVPNNGNKVRQLDIETYLISGMQGVGDTDIVNNYRRESSIYIRMQNGVPYPDTLPGVPVDNSRYTLGEVGCEDNFISRDISSYYGSIKTEAPDQYGQIYSYQAIDTGFQFLVDVQNEFTGAATEDVFGGDTFINKFAFKRKLPFFIDNRVNFPDEADVFYDELGNIGFPRYWFSTDIRRGEGGSFGIGALFGVKVNNFDCENSSFFYNAGKIYLFAYSIVNFFVESSVNVDYRQAYNSLEGDYFPHVSSDIPDDWFQEVNVPIAFDNTYTYNKTYSKQNTENTFSTLPTNFTVKECTQKFPNRMIFSEVQQDVVNYNKNNWRIYRPVSVFDFPLNYGKLTSVDGIETRQMLARFENKTLLYNSLLTVTANIGDVYLGQQIFNKNIPPVDFAETDLGYTGSQHKFILNTEFGHIWIDAKRGDIFIVQGQSIQDISNEGVKLFLTNNLNFQLKLYFPDYDIDNNFKGVGIDGVYDNKYNRFIFTKLDYKPVVEGISYDSINDVFRLNNQIIELTDQRYFCDVSFTISYSFITKSWTCFHTYLPRYYIGDLNKFHTGIPGSVWTHNIDESNYNNFYGEIHPYILEYPVSYQYQDEILQSVKDYSKVNKVTNASSFVQTNNDFFNKAIIYNDQQCSGVLNLIAKPQNSLAAYITYPKYNSDSKDILFVKSDNFYNYNGFWDIVRSYEEPVWLADCTSASENKLLNTSNLDYSNRPYKKYPIRAKDCRIRHILDNKSNVRITSQFLSSQSQISYK